MDFSAKIVQHISASMRVKRVNEQVKYKYPKRLSAFRSEEKKIILILDIFDSAKRGTVEDSES